VKPNPRSQTTNPKFPISSPNHPEPKTHRLRNLSRFCMILAFHKGTSYLDIDELGWNDLGDGSGDSGRRGSRGSSSGRDTTTSTGVACGYVFTRLHEVIGEAACTSGNCIHRFRSAGNSRNSDRAGTGEDFGGAGFDNRGRGHYATEIHVTLCDTTIVVLQGSFTPVFVTSVGVLGSNSHRSEGEDGNDRSEHNLAVK